MNKYSNIKIYFFSGTGNAKKASEWVIQVANTYNIDSELINIDGYKFNDNSVFDSKTLIGFCSPTHGFNLPPIMLEFIFKFPKVKNVDVFILNTRAGMKMYKLFIPGLSGVAQILPAIVLKLKGFNIVGMQPMDLPSNWISIHPGLKEKVIISIFKRCERITKRFANNLLSGRKVYKALISIPVDLLISPISFGYYFIGRFGIAKTFIASDSCNNCGLCLKKCPINAIENIQDRMYWTFNCESCMRCINNCPKRAIETAHGFSFLIWWLIISVIPALVINEIINLEILDPKIDLFWVEIINLSFTTFIALFNIYLAYEVLHFLLRFKFINRLVVYTSFTKYRFWRRYKVPKITAI